MKKFLIILWFSILANLSHSQSYQWAGGLRLGGGIGLSVQTLVGKKTTIESQIRFKESSNYTEFAILLREHHKIAFRRFNMYTGGGFFTGFYSSESRDANRNRLGLSLLAGIEMSIGKLNLSLDIRPDFCVNGNGPLLVAHSAIGIRHVFVARKKKKIRIQVPFIRKKTDANKEVVD